MPPMPMTSSGTEIERTAPGRPHYALLLRGEGYELHVERTLDEPDSCNENDQRRAAEENSLPIERCPTKEERDRQERADDPQLPGLNAEVETDERQREGTLRQAELLQGTRKAEAVDQPE